MPRASLPWKIRSVCNDIFRSAITLGIQARNGWTETLHAPDIAGSAVRGRLVSILIPTLARGPHAGRLLTLQALLAEDLPAQTHRDYEAIVYCDGRNEAVERMVERLDDHRIRVFWTDGTIGSAWGHPQTRFGIDVARGDYFVRINDDNHPYPGYLQTLLQGFRGDAGISYARVVFKGDARRAYGYLLRGSWVIPRDRAGVLENGNIDCLCYMVRMDLARRYRNAWGDVYAADWRFLEAMLRDGVKASYTNRLIADKY